MNKRLSLWLTQEEEKEVEKLKKKAREDRRSLTQYCKTKLFDNKK